MSYDCRLTVTVGKALAYPRSHSPKVDGRVNVFEHYFGGEPEPEIPTELDDWDRDFELATGELPTFSRLHASNVVALTVFEQSFSRSQYVTRRFLQSGDVVSRRVPPG